MRTIFAVTLLILAGAPAKPAAQAGTLIVLNKHEANGWLIDLATGEVKAKVDTGAGPHEGAASPNGKRVVVANYGRQSAGSTLTVIDVTKGELVGTISLGELRRPHGLRWLDDDRVLVTVEDSHAVAIVNVTTGKVEKKIPNADQDVSHMIALSPDKKTAFVSNIGSGTLSVVDLGAGKVVENIKADAGTEGINVRPGGKEIWVTNTKADTVSIVRMKDHKLMRTMPACDFPIRVAFTNDGKQALVACLNSNELLVFDANSKKLVRHIAFEKDSEPIGVLPHPDGRYVYVALSSANQVAVLDTQTWKVVQTIATGQVPDGMAFSRLQTQAPVQ